MTRPREHIRVRNHRVVARIGVLNDVEIFSVVEGVLKDKKLTPENVKQLSRALGYPTLNQVGIRAWFQLLNELLFMY